MHTILIVDDSPMMTLTLNAIFASDYLVRVATNGKDALLDVRSRQPPDIILLDVTMPDMDGYEVCRQLKADPAVADIPVIFLTSHTGHDQEEAGFAAGAVDYIHKPFNATVVMARVKAQLAFLEARKSALRQQEQIAALERQERAQAFLVMLRRLEYLVEATGQGVWDFDVKTRVVMHNSQWCRMLGLDESYLQHPVDQFSALLHPDDKQAVAQRIDDCLNGQGDYFSVHRLKHADGSMLWVEDQGKVVERDAAGNPQRMVGSIRNITANKLIELKYAELSEQNRNIINNAPVGIFLYRADGQCLSANEAGAALVGCSVPEILKKNFHDIEAWKTHGLIAASQLVLSDRQSREMPLNATTADGRDLNAQFRFNAFEADGQVHLLVIANDTTEQIRRLEAEQARETEKKANEAKSRFLATVTHEIRTPLNGIIGIAQLLGSEDVGSDEYTDYINILKTSGQQLLYILNDILDYSAIEAHKLQLKMTHFAPDEIIEECRVLFKAMAEQNGLALIVDSSGLSGKVIRGDKPRLRQILSNLVSNAIKFTPKGSVRIEAREVSSTPEKALFEFAVVDTGVGIPADKIDRLFKVFSQIDNGLARKHEGTGLGLSITKNLVELMDGTIEVSSVEHRGTTFVVRVVFETAAPEEGDQTAMAPTLLAPALPEPPSLPVSKPAFDSVPAPENSPPDTGEVLVVDDNRINVRVTASFLKKLGYPVRLLANGQEAVDAIRQGARPIMILMDIRMPVLDGIEATRQIRSLEQQHAYPRTPIVALSGHARADSVEHCLAAGMDDFLAKPINVELLAQMLAHCVEQRQPEAALPQ